MKKTRKIRNKKLFLKWLKKSHRNKYNIVHGGANGDEVKDTTSNQVAKAEEGNTTFTKQNAVLLAGAVTLGEVAFRLASNPVVVSAVVGLGIGSAAFTGIVSGGATLVLILVATYAFVKIRALYSNYYTMIYVMNDYILLLKKIDTMVRLSVKISQQYKFVIDTKDVNKSLERIFGRFDKLLSDKDISDINKDVLDSKDNSMLTELASEVNEDDDEKLPLIQAQEAEETVDIVVPQTVKNRQENIFKRFVSSVKKFKKVISLNSKKFTEELNEEVMRLGLYFSILLGEFNIILNVCQMDIISKGDKNELMTKNNNVKSDDNFNNLLISSIIYRTLQLYNIFNLCDTISSKSETSKTICSPANKSEYIKEINRERMNIRTVLFGTTTSDSKTLFPLYAPLSSNTNNGLQKLREIMKGFNKPITEESQALEFLKRIHEFNDTYSKEISKSAPSSMPSFSIKDENTTNEQIGNTADTAVKPAVNQPYKDFNINRPFLPSNPVVTNPPRLPPPPSNTQGEPAVEY
jgi:hypothetical protein